MADTMREQVSIRALQENNEEGSVRKYMGRGGWRKLVSGATTDEREKSSGAEEGNSKLSGKIADKMRRASVLFRSKSERGMNKGGEGRPSSTPIGGSTRRLVTEDSSRNMTEPLDDEQKTAPALRHLPAAGFNRLKTMWANRESMTGFSSPLATWTRPYGVHKKPEGDVHVSFDPKSKTYSGKFDPDRIEGKTFKQFGCSIVDCPRVSVPEYKEQIPSVLLLLRDELEKQNGFLVEGVFRVAASFEDQKAYKVEVDDGSFKGCKSQDDAMCMAALLKEWFRTMPVRLLNSLPLNSIRNGKADIMKELPEPNLSVFLWLCDLMADIVSLEQVNRMSARAMAIVIAPNLYSAGETASPQDIMQEMNGAVSIVEAALKERIAQRKAVASARIATSGGDSNVL